MISCRPRYVMSTHHAVLRQHRQTGEPNRAASVERLASSIRHAHSRQMVQDPRLTGRSAAK